MFLPLIRNYPTKPIPNYIAQIIVDNDDWEVCLGTCYAELNNERYSIKFWSANRMYAFFNDGSAIDKVTKKKLSWRNAMCSRSLAWKVLEKIKKVEKTDESLLKEWQAAI